VVRHPLFPAEKIEADLACVMIGTRLVVLQYANFTDTWMTQEILGRILGGSDGGGLGKALQDATSGGMVKRWHRRCSLADTIPRDELAALAACVYE
jgi:hypothetical protein